MNKKCLAQSPAGKPTGDADQTKTSAPALPCPTPPQHHSAREAGKRGDGLVRHQHAVDGMNHTVCAQHVYQSGI